MKGIHQNGKMTFVAGAAIAAGEFVKFSSGKVVKCAAATDIAIGVALDSASADGEQIPVQLLTGGDTVLVKAGLVASKSEARRAVEQGGVSVDGEKVTDLKAVYSGDALRAGKVFRRIGFRADIGDVFTGDEHFVFRVRQDSVRHAQGIIPAHRGLGNELPLLPSREYDRAVFAHVIGFIQQRAC